MTVGELWKQSAAPREPIAEKNSVVLQIVAMVDFATHGDDVA